MCGITGLIAPADQNGEELRATVERMAQTLAHRGPDDAGVAKAIEVLKATANPDGASGR